MIHNEIYIKEHIHAHQIKFCFFIAFFLSLFSHSSFPVEKVSMKYDSYTGEPILNVIHIRYIDPGKPLLDYKKMNHPDAKVREEYFKNLTEVQNQDKRYYQSLRIEGASNEEFEYIKKLYVHEHALWLEGFRHSTYDWNADREISNEFFIRKYKSPPRFIRTINLKE